MQARMQKQASARSGRNVVVSYTEPDASAVDGSEEDEEDEDEEDAPCEICRSSANDKQMLLCDGCDKGYHTFCLKPKLKGIPDGDWFCPNCKEKGKKEEDEDGADEVRSKLVERYGSGDKCDICARLGGGRRRPALAPRGEESQLQRGRLLQIARGRRLARWWQDGREEGVPDGRHEGQGGQDDQERQDGGGREARGERLGGGSDGDRPRGRFGPPSLPRYALYGEPLWNGTTGA